MGEMLQAPPGLRDAESANLCGFAEGVKVCEYASNYGLKP